MSFKIKWLYGWNKEEAKQGHPPQFSCDANKEDGIRQLGLLSGATNTFEYSSYTMYGWRVTELNSPRGGCWVYLEELKFGEWEPPPVRPQFKAVEVDL